MQILLGLGVQCNMRWMGGGGMLMQVLGPGDAEEDR